MRQTMPDMMRRFRIEDRNAIWFEQTIWEDFTLTANAARQLCQQIARPVVSIMVQSDQNNNSVIYLRDSLVSANPVRGFSINPGQVMIITTAGNYSNMQGTNVPGGSQYMNQGNSPAGQSGVLLNTSDFWIMTAGNNQIVHMNYSIAVNQ